jgi:hypothetical protein
MAAGTPASDGLTGGDVVFTPGRGYRAPLLRRGALSLMASGVAVLLAALGVLSVITWSAAVLFGLSALLQGLLYVWRGRFGTRLCPQGIEARGYFDHFIPWSDVAGLDVGGVQELGADVSAIAGTPWNSPVKRPWVMYGSEGGYRARMATIRVARRSGRTTLLRAPLVTSWQDDPEFEDKARLIRRWWHDYGHAAP